MAQPLHGNPKVALSEENIKTPTTLDKNFETKTKQIFYSSINSFIASQSAFNKEINFFGQTFGCLS